MHLPRILFGVFLALVVGFSIWEASRWRDSAYTGGLTEGQKKRRLAGASLLAVVAAMCFYGTYLPGPVNTLKPIQAADQLVYWGVCMLCAIGVVFVAWVETRQTLRYLAEARVRVIQETLRSDGDDAPHRMEPSSEATDA